MIKKIIIFLLFILLISCKSKLEEDVYVRLENVKNKIENNQKKIESFGYIHAITPKYELKERIKYFVKNKRDELKKIEKKGKDSPEFDEIIYKLENQIIHDYNKRLESAKSVEDYFSEYNQNISEVEIDEKLNYENYVNLMWLSEITVLSKNLCDFNTKEECKRKANNEFMNLYYMAIKGRIDFKELKENKSKNLVPFRIDYEIY